MARTAAVIECKKVAVMGAAGGIGQPLSLLLKMNKCVTELALYDIANVKGVVADLSHCNTPVKVGAARPGQGVTAKTISQGWPAHRQRVLTGQPHAAAWVVAWGAPDRGRLLPHIIIPPLFPWFLDCAGVALACMLHIPQMSNAQLMSRDPSSFYPPAPPAACAPPPPIDDQALAPWTFP